MTASTTLDGAAAFNPSGTGSARSICRGCNCVIAWCQSLSYVLVRGCSCAFWVLDVCVCVCELFDQLFGFGPPPSFLFHFLVSPYARVACFCFEMGNILLWNIWMRTQCFPFLWHFYFCEGKRILCFCFSLSLSVSSVLLFLTIKVFVADFLQTRRVVFGWKILGSRRKSKIILFSPRRPCFTGGYLVRVRPAMRLRQIAGRGIEKAFLKTGFSTWFFGVLLDVFTRSWKAGEMREERGVGLGGSSSTVPSVFVFRGVTFAVNEPCECPS